MKIRAQTLELLARKMGNFSTAPQLISLLKDSGVSADLIVYPNTKWKMVYDVLIHLSKSDSWQNHLVLYRVISNFIHPINFNGDFEATDKFIQEFSRLLQYDSFVKHPIL